MKILLQELCRVKKGWDEPLEEKTMRQWNNCITDLRGVQDIAVPRCYLAGVTGNILSAELHGFSDASNTAYAAVLYLRMVPESGIITRLVASKTRVAPLSKQTIPRLELLGAVILSRLAVYIKEVLEKSLVIDRLCFWTDSLVSFYWITGETRDWKQFMQNQVDEIRDHVQPAKWRFCPGSDNPADLPSRGVKASNLSSDVKWWEGPYWLKLSEEAWPSPKKVENPPDGALEEMKADSRRLQDVLTNVTTSKAVGLGSLISPEKFSSAHYVLRFIHNTRATKLCLE